MKTQKTKTRTAEAVGNLLTLIVLSPFFPVSYTHLNKGGSGMMTVQVMDGEGVAAEKVIGLAEGQFRVVTMNVTLEAGEHTITVGDMSETIVVE